MKRQNPFSTVRCMKCLKLVPKREFNWEQDRCFSCSDPENFKEIREEKEFEKIWRKKDQ